MSEQITQEINFTELVERRKILLLIYNEEPQSFGEKEENKLQEINKQIKKAEWLLMRAMFWMQECFAPNYFYNEKGICDDAIFRNLLYYFFLMPSPDKFKQINHILNSNNINIIQNYLIGNLLKEINFQFLSNVFTIINYGATTIPLFFTTELSKDIISKISTPIEEFSIINSNTNQDNLFDILISYYKDFIEQKSKNVDYTCNLFPQNAQGNYYFSQQVKPSELQRDFGMKNLSLKTTDNFEETYSLFEYCTLDWENTDELQKDIYVSNTVAYLESRYITCHFDGQSFASDEQPNEITRNFYMHIWRGSSKLLQNLARYHLNTSSALYENAKNKFRSQEFQEYILKNKDKTNDLLFAFIFCPNEFSSSKDYDEIIASAKKSKYYSSIMAIDKLIHERDFYIDIDTNEELIFSTLFKLLSTIDPSKTENKIDSLLLDNKLLIELSIKSNCSTDEKLLYQSIFSLYDNPNIITNLTIPLHFQLTCLSTATALNDPNDFHEINNCNINPNIFIHEPYFKFLYKNCNTNILIAAYWLFKKMDELSLSDCKQYVTYEMIECIYTYDLTYYRGLTENFDSLLVEFNQTKNPSTFIERITTNPNIEKNSCKENELKIAIKPIYLLISSHTSQNQQTNNLLDKLNSLDQNELKSLTDIIRTNPIQLARISNEICNSQDIHKFIAENSIVENPFDDLLENYSSITKQTFLDFYKQNYDTIYEINKLPRNQKRLFILMCTKKEKGFFKDKITIINSECIPTLFRYFQAIQSLDIPDTTKYEMTMNMRYLYMATDCQKIDPDFLVATIFKKDLIYELANNKTIRDEFIKDPAKFLSEYTETKETDENSISFKTKIILSNAAKYAVEKELKVSPEEFTGFKPLEIDYYIKHFLFAGGKVKNLPEEFQNLASTKKILSILKSQNECIPQQTEQVR